MMPNILKLSKCFLDFKMNGKVKKEKTAEYEKLFPKASEESKVSILVVDWLIICTLFTFVQILLSARSVIIAQSSSA